MRVSSTFLGVVAAVCLALTPVFADSHGAAPASKPPTAGKPTVKPTASKPTSSKPTTTGKPMKSIAGKPSTTTTTRTSGKAAKPTKSASTKKSSTGSTSTTNTGSTSTTTGAGSTTTTTELNPIAAKISSKPNLSSKVSGMLPIDPVTGQTMTLDKASLGFKNQGQFIAALHVSQNLGVSFTELKSHMVTVTPGTGAAQPTATQTGSLGQAIQAVKKTANSTTEAEKGQTQATSDLLNAGPTATTTTTNTTTTSASTPPNKTKKKTTTGGAQ